MDILERRIDVGGLTVQLWEAGREHGQAVVLLHGGIGDACVNWHPALPALSEQYHVFAPNLPGYGESALLPEMTFEHLLAWLRDLLDTLGQDNFVMIGAFIGALLVRLFAAAEPTYVTAVILVNGGGIPQFPRPLSALMRLPVIGRIALETFGMFTLSSKVLDEMIYVKSAVTPELVDSWRQNKRSFKCLIRAMIGCRCPKDRVLSAPTLLLWGTNDPLMTPDAAEQMQQNIPGSVLSPIVDCGLMPHLEAADTFVFQVESFLDHVNHPRANLPGAGMLHLP